MLTVHKKVTSTKIARKLTKAIEKRPTYTGINYSFSSLSIKEFQLNNGLPFHVRSRAAHRIKAQISKSGDQLICRQFIV